MKDKKAEIFDLFKEAGNHNHPVKKERRISLRFLFLFFALFAIFATVMLLAYVRLQKNHHELQETFNRKGLNILQRAEELEGEKRYVASKEMYLSALGIGSSHDKEIETAEKRLDNKIEHMKEVRAYKGNLQIRNVAIRKDKLELKVSGTIINKGKRPLHEIELTIYCLDEGQKQICEEKFSAVSSDGKPLSRYQKRPFKFLRTYDRKEYSKGIPAVPVLVDKVQVVVTDIGFADQ